MNRITFTFRCASHGIFFLYLILFCGVANAQTDLGPTSPFPKNFGFSELVFSRIPKRFKFGQTIHFTLKNVGKYPQRIYFFLGVQPREYDPKWKGQFAWPLFTYDLWDVLSETHRREFNVKPGQTLKLSWAPNIKLFSDLYLRHRMLQIQAEDTRAGTWSGPTFYSTPFHVDR